MYKSIDTINRNKAEIRRVRLQLLQIDCNQVKKAAPMLSSPTEWREMIAQNLKKKAAKHRIIANTPAWM